MKLRNKKTGETGYFCFANWDDPVLIIMDRNGIQLAKYNSLVELNAEWKDYEEPKGYWWISLVDTDVVHCVEDVKDEVDKYNKEIGNYFETKEEAEKAVEKLKAVKRLKDKGFRFTNWEFRDVLDGELVIEAKLNFDNDSSIQRDLEICFGGEE